MRRERMERQIVAEAKLRHLKVRVGSTGPANLVCVFRHQVLFNCDGAAGVAVLGWLRTSCQAATMDQCCLGHHQQPGQQSTAAVTWFASI